MANVLFNGLTLMLLLTVLNTISEKTIRCFESF